jgi:hypothetical protein
MVVVVTAYWATREPIRVEQQRDALLTSKGVALQIVSKSQHASAIQSLFFCVPRKFLDFETEEIDMVVHEEIYVTPSLHAWFQFSS